MKKIVLVSAFALLAACGGSSKGGSATTIADHSAPAAGSGTTVTSADGSDDTITVENFGDMPAECIGLLSTFLKQIEPIVSEQDWSKATLADFEALGKQFEADNTAFDTQSAAAGCDKYQITGSDAEQFQHVVELAAAEAPGTVEFLTFISSLSDDPTTSDGSLPADCVGTIAAIEVYLDKGTMKDLTMAEVARFGQLLTGISDQCTPEEAAAFNAREDFKTFIAG